MLILVLVGLASAPALPVPAGPDDLLLDWSAWEKKEALRDEEDIASTGMQQGSGSWGCLEGSEGSGCQTFAGARELRRFVGECAARLQLPENPCKDKEEPVLEHDYRVPLMGSISACGFEKRMTREAMEQLASRYTFHLIGDSTSRRLGESFVSIFTGKGSTHPVAQQNRNFSSGNLKVLFYWAPHCSGPESIGAVLEAVLEGVEAAKGDGKRAVIVTAFGVHDAFELHHSANGHGSASYESGLPQDIVEKDGMRAAALSACRDTTMRITTAATGKGVVGADIMQPPGGLRGRVRALFDQDHLEASSSGAMDQSGVSIAVGKDGMAGVVPTASPGSLFFLLQNNRYPPGSVEDVFLEDLHRIQRQTVQAWEKDRGGDTGLFLVNDSVSLYGNLSCYRNANPIHFFEPVKLVEGKMLWDLLALVDQH
eukprot:g7918.t1